MGHLWHHEGRLPDWKAFDYAAPPCARYTVAEIFLRFDYTDDIHQTRCIFFYAKCIGFRQRSVDGYSENKVSSRPFRFGMRHRWRVSVRSKENDRERKRPNDHMIAAICRQRTCSTLMRAFSSFPSAISFAISFLLTLTESTSKVGGSVEHEQQD